MAQVKVLAPGQARTRHTRTPVFPQAGTMKPFGLYPLMIHPVLPGETLQSAKTKMRTISKPVNHPLSGAWLETWLFYVKFTDIDRDLGEMFVSDTFSSSGYTAGSDNERLFVKSGQIDWVGKCLERIADSYFTHQEETPIAYDSVYQTKLNQKSWIANVMVRPDEVATDTSDVFDSQEEITAFQMMQMMSMQELSYEKYLKEFGVQSVRTGIGEPEMLRWSRSWTQPVNTVDPTDGSPSSAWVWSDEIKAEKPKRFDEPGFIIQLAAVRPKMFLNYLETSIVGNFWGFTDWFPIYNLDDPNAGVRTINTDDDVFDAAANAAEASDELWYDHRDILNHGEQFINDRTNNPFNLPLATGPLLTAAATDQERRGEYCTETDVNNLFVGTNAADRLCYYDGITMLRISGHTRDLIK